MIASVTKIALPGAPSRRFVHRSTILGLCHIRKSHEVNTVLGSNLYKPQWLYCARLTQGLEALRLGTSG